MTCDEIQARFSALLDDDVTANERRALEGHREGCLECARAWSRFTDTVRLVRSLEPARAPAGFVDRVVAAARPRPWHRRLLGGVPPAARWATAAAALAAVVAIVYGAREPAPVTVARAPAPAPAVAPAPAAPPPPVVAQTPVAAPAPEPSAPAPAEPAPARRAVEAPAAERRGLPRAGEAPRAAPTVPRPAEPPGGDWREPSVRSFARSAPDSAYRPAVAPPAASERAGAIVGRLVVEDPAAAEQVLDALAARFDARLLARTATPGGVVLQFALPPGGSSRFVGEVARLGRWSVERAEGPDARVIVHLTR